MAETHNEYITVLAGEALEPYRRVKYAGSGTVSYADATDGNGWVGITEPGPDGDGVASGDPIKIRLRTGGDTMRCETAGAIALNAAVYACDDGKIDDTDPGSGTLIGRLAGVPVPAASGTYASFHAYTATGAAPDEEAVANAHGTTGAGVPIVLVRRAMTQATDLEIKKPARKLRLLAAWGTLRNGTTATDVYLKITGGTAHCAAVAFTTEDADVRKKFDLNDAVTDIASTVTLYANIATACTAPGMEVYVLALPVS